jgi:hypothetical protein
MNNEQFLNIIKELVKEEVNKNKMLLESPTSDRIDKILTEKLSRILNKKK